MATSERLPSLFDVDEAATRLRVTRWTIYAMVKGGRLRPCHLTGRKLLFTEQALAEAVAQAEGRQLVVVETAEA